MNLEKTKKKINKYLELIDEGVLKGEELQELISELKQLKLPEKTPEIIERKIEKLKKQPHSVWSDINGYTQDKTILKKWANLINKL